MHTASPMPGGATQRPGPTAARRRNAADAGSATGYSPRTVLHLPELRGNGGWGEPGAIAHEDRQGHGGHERGLAEGIAGIVGACRHALTGVHQPKLLLAVLMAVALQLVVLVVLLGPGTKSDDPSPGENETASQTGGATLPAAPPSPASTHENTAGPPGVAPGAMTPMEAAPRLPQLDPKDVPPWEAAASRVAPGVANQPAAVDAVAPPEYRTATLPTETTPTTTGPSVPRLRGTIGPATGTAPHEQAQPGLY